MDPIILWSVMHDLRKRSQRLLQEKFLQFLSKLPAPDRRILQAIVVERKAMAEVCRQFGVKRDVLLMMVYRAKRAFYSEFHRLPGDATEVPVKKPTVN
ncbi:MAG TPA: hypothetical protein VH110_03875 [Candidatus Acidoferrum sp.]|nr:hypothetical protein [Candidatus Acidoferrum sp.]